MKDHIIVLGFGTKGRNAARALVLKGTPRGQIVVVDSEHAAANDATEAGYGAIVGSAVSEDVLRRALIDRAHAVIVALDRDDSAILATLTIRRAAAGPGLAEPADGRGVRGPALVRARPGPRAATGPPR
jgi:voltage-gated potassium channel